MMDGSSRSRGSLFIRSLRLAGSKRDEHTISLEVEKQGKEIGSGQRGSLVASTIMIIAFFCCFSFIFFLFSFFSLSRNEKAEGGRTSGSDDHADVRCVVRAAASSRPSPLFPHDLSMAEDGR